VVDFRGESKIDWNVCSISVMSFVMGSLMSGIEKRHINQSIINDPRIGSVLVGCARPQRWLKLVAVEWKIFPDKITCNDFAIAPDTAAPIRKQLNKTLKHGSDCSVVDL